MFRATRSKEAPMDFEWTNRPQVKPAWSSEQEQTPRKRPIDEVNAPQHGLGTPQTPIFGSSNNQNVPFIFQSALPSGSSSYSWAPPSNITPGTPEVNDVDMSETSPFKTGNDDNEKENDGPEKGRPMALGALRRVYNQRQKSRISKSNLSRRRSSNEDEGTDVSNDESDEHMPLTQNTSNHYTLNMPTPAPPPSETPYVLLGYLQFFFNLSLVLLFLYLVVQFIITIQRDVEQRVSEYSQEIVQEIAMCALQFKNNLCETNLVPGMVQQCAKWEACMNRDPAVIGRAKVSAELIAEVVNGFVEPISWKTLIFTLTSLSFLTIFVNTLLSLYRSRHQPVHDRTSTQSYPIAPGPAFHPHFPPYGAHTPGANWSRLQPEENQETPARRRKLESGNPEKVK